MSIFEYDEEAVFEVVRKDEYEKGLQEGVIAGKAEDILELLEEVGTVPNEVCEKIMNEKNINVLNSWLKQAAKVNSVEDFISKI